MLKERQKEAQPDDADIVDRWASDPQAFVEEALGVEEITTQQKMALRELGKLVNAKVRKSLGARLSPEEAEYAKKRGISIMSGQGTGKDAFVSWAIIWFLCCFPFPKIPCTGPTGKQLKDVLWSEISKWLRTSAVKDWLIWQAERIFHRDHGGERWFATARTANPKATADEQAETLGGFHEDYMMIVVDEASGVPEPVFRPLEGTLTGICNFILMIFNPTRAKGFAVESQTKYRKDWICLRWNAEDSERVQKDHIEAMARKYGTTSNTYRVRVLGLPPEADPDALIPWDWVMDCVELDLEPAEDDPVVIGVDVARFGDDKSAICPRRGPKVFPIKEYHKIDTELLTGWIIGEIVSLEPVAVMVDTVGVGGGVADKLRHRTEVYIYDVNVHEVSANDPARFRRLRDELWWNMRELFEKRQISIPNDAELIGELTTPKYNLGDDGRIQAESKKDVKSRAEENMGSPNKADSLALTTYLKPQFLRSKFMAKTKPQTRKPTNWRVA